MSLPPYSIFPNITGNKILLREIISEDIYDLVEISYYNAVKASTVEQATAMLNNINNDYGNGNSIHWGIAEKETNKIVGTCGYYRGFDKQSGELGCVLLPQYRGQGYMTAAMLLAIEFGKKTMELKRIWAVTNQQNSEAIKLLERLNFIKISELEDNEVEFELR